MMEVPLALWVVLSFWLFIEGLSRPRLHLALAFPLGAAILTKSVLGLLPLAIVGAAVAILPSLRAPLRRPWIWLGSLAGILVGATWTLDQYAVFGTAFLEEHYGREIVRRAAERADIWQVVSSYPRALLTSYQPVVLPALAGAFFLWQRRRDSTRAAASAFLVVWAVLPVLLYSLSSARSPRYVFPVFPPLALCASDFLTSRWPRAAEWLRKGAAPALLVVAAVVYWVRPGLLGRSGTSVFKADRQVRARVPAGEPLTYLANGYDWGLANPLLYYCERILEPPTAPASRAASMAKRRSSRLLMVERARLPDLGGLALSPILLAGGSWVLLDLRGEGAAASGPAGSLTRLGPDR
jgi:4-amino-4-deoxy-L-arabinose transferase-like glycosyltransferase